MNATEIVCKGDSVIISGATAKQLRQQCSPEMDVESFTVQLLESAVERRSQNQ